VIFAYQDVAWSRSHILITVKPIAVGSCSFLTEEVSIHDQECVIAQEGVVVVSLLHGDPSASSSSRAVMVRCPNHS
jgi:hypothetical protein